MLLKNENSFFPIDASKKITIAVIGENSTKPMTIGGGSSELKALNEISPLDGLKNRYKNATIIHAMGYASGPSAYGRVVPSTLDANKLKKEAQNGCTMLLLTANVKIYDKKPYLVFEGICME